MKEQKQSTTDPESGWFHKGEHKEVFAYGIETGCDKHGWILGYTVHPGNEHDNTTFPYVYEKLRLFEPRAMVLDAGYKNPPIAKLLIAEDIRRTPKGKDLYAKRKETIERIFGTAKEHHSMRYTQQVGKEKMAMKIGLTFACMNMKKLANILSKRPKNGSDEGPSSRFSRILFSLLNFNYSFAIE